MTHSRLSAHGNGTWEWDMGMGLCKRNTHTVDVRIVSVRLPSSLVMMPPALLSSNNTEQ